MLFLLGRLVCMIVCGSVLWFRGFDDAMGEKRYVWKEGGERC